MTCEEARDELIAYARGELSAVRKAAVEEHLARCAGCTRELEGSRQVMALTQMADDASIADLAQSLIQTALQRSASDMHLEMAARGEPRIRLRISGVLHEGPALTRQQYEPLMAHVKRLAAMNVSERRVPQDGRIAMTLDGKEYDLRVSTVPYLDGEGAVMRILDRSTGLMGLDTLGLAPRMLEQLEALIAQRDGLILTTGPSGAGKSTLLYAILNRLNRPELKILTVEDPVEYRLRGVNQLAVQQRVGVTFATAMRALMRQDPEIFMVGELRDRETVELCVRAALTGHLVLSSLHTRDATAALTRLGAIGIEPFLVADAVRGVIGQRLVRRVCRECKAPYEPARDALTGLEFTEEARPRQFLHGTGCDACGGTGYRGRIGLFELLTVNEELAQMIIARAPESALRQRALEMKTLWPFLADARAKITSGVTTAEEVDRVLMGIHSAGKG